MEREELVLGLGELAVRISEGWNEVIEIDALDIMLLNEAAEALAQPALEPVAWMYPDALCDKACLYVCTKAFTQFPECATTPPQPAQKPKSFTYNEVADAMNSFRKGNSVQKAYAEEVGKLKLYAAPQQRPWLEPTDNEWFEWWRVSKVADETEAEIDFADFLIIAQAVVAKLKEKNNGA